MQIVRFNTSSEFFETFSALWLRNEAECGVIYRVAQANRDDMLYFAVLNEESQPALTACLNPSDQILLTGSEPEAAQLLSAYLAENRLEVPGIFAPSHLSQSFAQSYAAAVGTAFRAVKSLGHYSLQQIGDRPDSKGIVRLAAPNEQPLMTRFRDAMQREGNTQRPVDATDTVISEIREQALYLLERPHGEIVSTGTIHWNRSPASAYVDHIYTPPEHRGNGYATALVHHLSDLILDQGQIARLSVDVENTAAIAVYEKLGYVRECRMDNLRRTG